ncbi:MAG TPA: Hsp70 family protein [Polyangiaceae bacterium]|nr:Hsp70 family protein [Polyangiaceae bacterium]
MTARFAVGIDLGTTHSALAYSSLERAAERPRVLAVPELVTRSSVESRTLLPSFLYFATESEEPLALPWDEKRRFAVGDYARTRAAETPGRVVASAKSWLCHPTVDRRGPILPAAAPEDVEKISPVEASFRYLDHLGEAWKHVLGGDAPLAEQAVVLAVPASFDAAARDLTVEAAYAAGMEDVTLLEEPQAALYAWIDAVGDDFRKHLRPGDVVLIVDVGGGTTDFSAVQVGENDGALELRRIAVGDHILLGGDNMDLALAHRVRARLEENGTELDSRQFSALAHACRAAKESLLGSDLAEAPVVLASRGSALLGGTIRAALTRADVVETVLDGFFPVTTPSDEPVKRARGGLRELGLPYAADPAITRHLSHFLRRQAGASADAGGTMLRPTALLFNGGVFKSQAIRDRLTTTLASWIETDGGVAPRILPAYDLDLAVARGAAYYGQVRRGRGLRIRGGTARAYYVGIEGAAPAVPGVEPPLTALCVAPFGMEEGTRADMPPHELGLVVGEPVRFRFFGSTVRRDDVAGTELERIRPAELSELTPIEIALPAEGRADGEVVAVRLESQVTPVGTLLLEAVPLNPKKPDERWKMELSVRESPG